MLFVERSNRTELLFDALAKRLGRRGRDPLARAVVVVQGAGMERWIAQRLARRHGVCAHVEFPFPRPFLESVFEAVAGPDGEPPPPWDLDRMTWAIAKRIHAGREDPLYAPLARHLAAADGDWRLVQLAHRIADVFDQYVTYRPDWITALETASGAPPATGATGSITAPPTTLAGFDGPDLAWQGALFRGLVEDLGAGHMANRAAAFLEAIGETPRVRPLASARGAGRPTRAARLPRAELEARLRRRFPDAIEIFAISTLPPLHLDVVRGLASLVDVRLSILAPSRAWYSDLWQALRDGDTATATPIAALLSGLGRLGADFQKTLIEGASPDGGEEDCFALPDAGRTDASLLARLQTRLLDLDEEALDGDARRVARADDSIRVHLCHGPRRELEVVLGLLRDAFLRDPTLRPEDVIVMAPDIDAIAADVEAVFGADAEADGQGGLPFRVADRGAYRRSPVAEAFRRLLALLGTRMARSAVFDWLAQADVAARFGLDEAGVEALSDWAERAGYRFGLDEAQRAATALPAERGHTLAGSLDRLVLAHALGESREVVAGRTPIGLDAFAEPAWIGAIGEVESLLRGAAEELRTPRTVADWTHWLAALLARSVDRSDANSHEHAAILAVLERLRSSALAAGFDRALAFEAIRERVVGVLEQTPAPQAFLAGGITFCQLVPLRAIPFRVVVVTGLVDGEFPRSHAALGFDAIAKAPRPGDRRLRDDDRHLFLEAILSARDRLILTVPARDLRDGAPRPPSIVVSELLDALEATFRLEGVGEGEVDVEGGSVAAPGDAGPAVVEGAAKKAGKALREWLVVEHPLQATSPRYFVRDRDPRLVSRSARAHRGALARRRVEEAEVLPVRRFLPVGGVPAIGGAAAEAELLLLDELIERVLRSTRHFARTVLGLRLPRPQAVASDLDPVELDNLEQSELGRGLFEALEAGEPLDRALERMRASPLLPVGEAGEWLARPLVEEVRTIAAIAAQVRAGGRLPDRAFALAVPRAGGGLVRLVGTLDRLWPNARVESDYGRIGSAGEAALWTRHLVLCALAEAGDALPCESIFVGRPISDDKAKKRVVRFGRVEDPVARLAELVALGESVAAAPLPFFARSSRLFAEKLAKFPADEPRAWRDARDTFEGRDDAQFRIPEAEEDLETGRVWEGCPPIARAEQTGLPHGFDAVARLVFTPLLAARRASSE